MVKKLQKINFAQPKLERALTCDPFFIISILIFFKPAKKFRIGISTPKGLNAIIAKT